MGGGRKWWQSRVDFGPTSAPGPVRYDFPFTGAKVKAEQRATRTASSMDHSLSMSDVSAVSGGGEARRPRRRVSGQKLPGLKQGREPQHRRKSTAECVSPRIFPLRCRLSPPALRSCKAFSLTPAARASLRNERPILWFQSANRTTSVCASL
jgi:hypothetical protein